jgi:hypothetical protein
VPLTDLAAGMMDRAMDRRLTYAAGLALAGGYAGDALLRWFCRGLGLQVDAETVERLEAYIVQTLLESGTPEGDVTMP